MWVASMVVMREERMVDLKVETKGSWKVDWTVDLTVERWVEMKAVEKVLKMADHLVVQMVDSTAVLLAGWMEPLMVDSTVASMVVL